MSNTTKTDSYRDPRWQKKRLQVFERDGFKCVACGDVTSPLHAHHISYNGQPWETPIDEIQTLCEDCHSSLPKHPKGGVFFGFESETMEGSDAVYQFMAFRHCPVCGETKSDCHSGCVLFVCGHAESMLPEKFGNYFQYQGNLQSGIPAYFLDGDMYRMKDGEVERLENSVDSENNWSDSFRKEMAAWHV